MTVRSRAGLAAREVLTLLGILIVVGGVAAAFAWPWAPEEPAGGDFLTRYAPDRDGSARLMARYGPDGQTQGWQSSNTRIVPGLRLYTDIRKAPSDAIMATYQRQDGSPTDGGIDPRLTSAQISETRLVELAADGTTTETWLYTLRDDRGELLTGLYAPSSDRDIVFTPAPMTLPAQAAIGDTWSQAGTFGAARYTWAGKLVEHGQYDGPAGQFDDCILVETRFTTTNDAASTETLTRDRLCAERGLIESETLDPATGQLTQHTLTVTASGALVHPGAAPPEPALLAAAPEPEALDTWKMARLGRARATGDTSEATIQPLWIPSDPPVVLAAGYQGDLVALDPGEPGAPPRWSFHSGGTVFGQPSFDPATGRIFFGSSDKRVYAVDARGLFLWSFETGDNVSSRPLVHADLAIVGSEDGTVYGLDAATGRQRWAFDAGAPVASWPASAGPVVVVGTDDGNVIALDPVSGRERWTYAASGAVEAPIVADGDLILVASRDGTLAALDQSTCTPDCSASWEVKPGGGLRTAPIIAAEQVLVVDEDGALIALDKESGKREWSTSGPTYVGAPILVGDSVLVATSSGGVDRIGLDGLRQGGWTATESATLGEEPSFRLGPAIGGSSAWIADTNAVVRRIGPPMTDAESSLALSWLLTTTRPPFNSNQVRLTPAEYAGGALVVDIGRNVSLLDPSTGTGRHLGTLPGDEMVSQVVDPVVVGDTLLVVVGQKLLAAHLPDVKVRWQADSDGQTILPPVVDGATVYWVSGKAGSGTPGSGVLRALDLATGALRWQAQVAPSLQVGQAVVSGDTVLLSTPPTAFDAPSGTVRWQATTDLGVVGGPVLSPDGGVLYVTGIRPGNDGGTVLALDVATGAERWQADLKGAAGTPLERLWLEDGTLVIPGLGGDVVALDAATGAERWHFHPPVSRLGGVTVSDGRVWLMLENARLYALDLDSGQPVARFADLQLNLNSQGLSQRPLLLGPRLIFPAGLAVLGLDATEALPR
ncbi:MAG: PQQ-binding-like beta-propeller repeat protein [Chloroflexi bacterium]|nr:PQQ-binding-like beta-propeller repeat protein [Chloroflexota bacterium]